jgi:hypothetical protein
VHAIQEFDWNFDAVPDGELVAGCYWEYARESAFICNLRQRCIRWWRKGGLRNAALTAAISKLHSMGPQVDVLFRGFYYAPDDPYRIDVARNACVTNSFPAPWQALPDNERDFRVRTLLSAGWYPATPFRRADWMEAEQVVEHARAKWDKVMEIYHRVRANDPETSEVELVRQGKLPPYGKIPPSLFDEGGREVTAVAIHWGRFTNEEIISHFRKWVKENRPQNIRLRDDKGRNKARDWRVALERLGMMRLLHQWSLRQLPEAAPAAWKLYGKREWYKERKRAQEMFHRLFPFLDRSERPLSWATAGGRSR